MAKMSRRKRAYEAYKLDWMIQHGYTLSDFIKEIGGYMEESEEDIVCSFDNWEFDCGFNGEIWACYEEFCENEYQDKEYVKQLLGEE